MELNTGVIVFIVYLMNQVNTVIENTSSIVSVGSIIMIVAVIVLVAVFLIAKAEGSDLTDSPTFMKAIKFMKWSGVVLVMCAVVTTCTPNKDSVLQIGIAYGATEVLKSDAAKKVGEEIATVAGKTSAVVNKKLDKMLED